MKKYLAVIFVILVCLTLLAMCGMGADSRLAGRPQAAPVATSTAAQGATSLQSIGSSVAISVEHTPTEGRRMKSSDSSDGTLVLASTTQNRPAASASPAEKAAPNVTLIVASTSYAVYAPPGSTVLDVMQIAASTTSFRFSAKHYPSLGMFINSIGGISNARGVYWTLYINGALSQLGASSVTVNPGDTVKWLYETL